MGGCRCTFRDCSNNTVNSPGKHFFHFPYKDEERCKKWALNSDKIPFLSLPWTQLRNKTVCEDHFVNTCFMNFKKERLVKTAIPTLYRTKTGVILDIKLNEAKLSSLDYRFNDKANDQKTIDLPDPSNQTIHVNLHLDELPTIDDDMLDTFVLNDAHTSTITKEPQTSPIVLNRICPKEGKRFSARNQIQEKSTIKRTAVDSDTTYTPNSKKRIKQELGEKTVSAIGRTYGKSNNSIATPDIEDSGSASTATDNGLNDAITANILEKINHIEERDANKVDKSLYMQMMTEHAKQIEDLKQLLTEKLADKQNELNDGHAKANSSSAPLIRVEKGTAMTKVQLFNGIRKYLNPTMVALLRMEMFGSSEREYRPDEKQLSKELYNLNKNVYDYMRDEWRFRLPPKIDVEEWLKHPDDEETWELC